MTLNEWRDRIHDWANRKGWWSRPTDTIVGKLLLIHSEISEAAEILRLARPCPKGDPDVDYDDLRTNHLTRCPHDPVCMKNDKSGNVGVDYNETRAERHGGKAI